MIRVIKKLFPSKAKGYKPPADLVNEQVAGMSKQSFIDALLGQGRNRLAANVLNIYWSTCAPLSDAVDKLSSRSAGIKPSVWDIKTEELDNEHPILELLNQPNMLENYEEFFKRLTGLYILHGEVYIVATGRINKKPAELFVVPSQTIIIDDNQLDGFPVSYTQQENHRMRKFYRHEVSGRFRYYDVPEDGNPNDALAEIIQIKSFNPFGSMIPTHGMSKLQSLYFEIEQWLASSRHNLSVLLRGATLSGIISTDANLQGLTKDQRASLIEQLDNYVGGADNAGKIGLFDNGLKFNSTTQTNKDLDFRFLKKDLKIEIYNRLDIPAPLVNEETMTMANRTVSLAQFYLDSIVPLTNLMYSFITLFVMYRYDNSENMALTVDTSNVPALESEKIEKITKLINFKILTINETRALIDYEPLKNGGDNIYGTSSSITLASDSDIEPRENTSGTQTESDNDDKEGEDEKSITRSKFFELMREQTDSNGKRRFTDERINAIANRENLK